MRAKKTYLRLCSAVLFLGIAGWISTTWLEFNINLTHSLPGTLYVVQKGASFGQGDLIAFRWHGGANYPAGATFIKHVSGMPGDQVKREGNTIWVNDQYIGVAKPVTKSGMPLSPTAPGTIAAGTYFVSTPNPNSLDSRYALTGNIPQSAIIGKAYAIF